ncbi:hypothetical protein L204_105967 [Cryptococcus depauperatus]
MEVNKEEALRALSIAQKHKSASNYTSALKFARKSVALFSTPEGEALVTVIEREIASSEPELTEKSSSGFSSANAKASGVEEHVTSAHLRPGHKTTKESSKAGDDRTRKRSYTPQQIEVVRRVKACKHHEYYEILEVEKTCSENEVKKAYKKLALALHPDKNGAPGADEAFKMVSKAFQVLSDSNLRTAYDSNPSYDPTQRNPGPSSFSSGGGGMGMRGHPGFAYNGDINPEDLFNMFFGGGGGFGNGGFGNANVFTFGGPGGFRTFQTGRPRQPRQADDGDATPLTSFLPILLVLLFSIITILPSLFSTPARDPSYSFESSARLNLERMTSNWKVPYWVSQREWESSDIWKSVPETRRGSGMEALFSQKVRLFEKNVEGHYVRRLQHECENFNDRKRSRIADHSGFFGIGADHDKINEIRKQTNPACEKLRGLGIGQGAIW